LLAHNCNLFLTCHCMILRNIPERLCCINRLHLKVPLCICSARVLWVIIHAAKGVLVNECQVLMCVSDATTMHACHWKCHADLGQSALPLIRIYLPPGYQRSGLPLVMWGNYQWCTQSNFVGCLRGALVVVGCMVCTVQIGAGDVTLRVIAASDSSVWLDSKLPRNQGIVPGQRPCC
jgi:hypothetical protein